MVSDTEIRETQRLTVNAGGGNVVQGSSHIRNPVLTVCVSRKIQNSYSYASKNHLNLHDPSNVDISKN